MLISMLAYRRWDTMAEVVVNYWTVAGGTVNVVRVRFDPQGPMSAQDAALACLRLAVYELEKRARPWVPQDEQLPFGDAP